MTTYPKAYVATIIEQNNRFLMVKETIRGQIKYNQPAGHWEHGETLAEAAVREVHEETGANVELSGLIGVYTSYLPQDEKSILRFCFSAKLLNFTADFKAQAPILEALWLNEEEIIALNTQLRTHLILQSIQDYKNKAPLPIDIIRNNESIT